MGDLQPPASQRVDTAQRVGQPVGPGHRPDHLRSLLRCEAGGGDVQRAGGGASSDLEGVGCAAEHALGHSDHGHLELGVGVGTQTGSTVGVELDVAVDDEQVEPVAVR